MKRLGIIDWGIGGISIYKLIKQDLGPIPISYLSDTGVTPYGKMTRGELATRLDNVIDYLKGRGVTHVVIGCNAASTVIPFLADHGIPVEGVIESAVKTSLKAKPTRLGLIGGRRTVLSGVYRRSFAEHGVALHQRVAQPLSGLIESGDIASPTLQAEARRILGPLRGCSHILLACTHYPAITPVLASFVPPTTKFIDPAASLVKLVAKWRIESQGVDEIMTTGDAALMKRSAHLAFGVDLARPSKVRI